MRRVFLKSFLSALMCACAALIAAAPVSLAQTKIVPVSRAEAMLSFAPLVKSAAPAVVNIYTRRVVRERSATPLFNDPFFSEIFRRSVPVWDRPGNGYKIHWAPGSSSAMTA